MANRAPTQQRSGPLLGDHDPGYARDSYIDHADGPRTRPYTEALYEALHEALHEARALEPDQILHLLDCCDVIH